MENENEYGSCPNCGESVHTSEMGSEADVVCCKHCYKEVKIKKEFDKKWNAGDFDSVVMCDDGKYRGLNDPGKIWKFLKKKLKEAENE